jgi:hypothetical protein
MSRLILNFLKKKQQKIESPSKKSEEIGLTKNGGLRVENLLLRGQRPLVSAIYQNQPLSHYLPPNMQLLQGPNGQVKLRVSSLLNNQRALLEKQRGLDSDYFWHLRV